jgi:hypothetical protein
MQLTIYTYDGHAINDGTNYVCGLPAAISPEAEGLFVETGSTWARLSGKKRPGVLFDLEIVGRGTIHSQREQLKQWFDCEDEEAKKLIAKDTADGDRQYYVYASALQIIEVSNGGHWLVRLACQNPIWLSETEYSTVWDITASGDTQVVNVAAGNLPARPVITLTPKLAKSGGFAHSYQVYVRNVTDNLFSDYEFDLGNGLNTAALVTAGEMQADGDDIQIKVDGQFSDRWLTDMNTANTKITGVLTLQPRIEMSLSGAIAGSGAISTIALKKTATNKTALGKLPVPCLVAIQTGSNFEVFSVGAKDAAKLTLTGTTRAQRQTSAIAHNDGDTIWWMQYDIQLMHGNPSYPGRTVSDAKKPINNLSTSTRTSKVYEVFTDADNLRAMRWTKARVASISKLSDPYTGSHGENADPATEMGMALKNAQVTNVWRAESGEITWTLYVPAGVTTITMSGDKRRESASWPVATLEASTDGRAWKVIWTEATPSSAAAWQSWSAHSGVALGATYYYLRLHFKGSLAASANNAAYSECQAATLALDSSKCPTIALSAKISNYYLDCTITNETTGESISIDGNLPIDKTLTIDCLSRTMTLDDGTNVLRWLTAKNTARAQWLDLQPGNNTLRFDDTGTTDVDAVIRLRYRNN